MRKLWTVAAIVLLAGSLAFAQAPASGSGSDQSTATQSSQPAAPPTDTSMPTGAPTAAGERDNKIFQGCLTGGNGAYTLATSEGQNYALAGESKDLEANVNKEVTVNGIVRNQQSGAISIWVASVSKVADTCASQTSSNTGAATTAIAAPSASSEPAAASTEPVAKDQSMPQSSAASTAAPDTSSQAAASSAPSTAAASPKEGENGAATSANQATSTPVTSATESTQGTEVAKAEQGEKSGALPQTASPLPLLGLLGFGSLAGGLIARFRK